MPPANTPLLFFGSPNPIVILLVLPVWLLKLFAVNIAAFLFHPSTSNWRNGPLTWCCWCVETSISAVLVGGQTINSSPYVRNSSEYRFAHSIIGQVMNRVQAAASEVLMHTYANRRFGQIHLAVTEEDNSAMSSESSDGHAEFAQGSNEIPEMGTDRLRNEFSRLRQTINQNEDAQTICTFFTALLPFVGVFALKGIVDNYGDLGRLLAGLCLFLVLDGHIQAWVSAGRSTIQQKLGLTVSLVAGLIITSNYMFPVDDFSMTKALSLRYAGSSFHGFLNTLLIVLLVDNFAKIATCAAKILLYAVPFVSPQQKRRLFQCAEYISQLYRCVLPAPQWIFYFLGDSPDSYRILDFAVAFTYASLKVREVIFIGMVLADACRNVFQVSNYGLTPSQKEITDAQMCSICHDKLTVPTKLTCTHIFCHSCIDTWLEREHTCPMCRSIVEKKNNQWKTGATSKLLRFY